jgi:hypothetical protein
LEPFSLIATYFGLISYLIISLFRTKKKMA